MCPAIAAFVFIVGGWRSEAGRHSLYFRFDRINIEKLICFNNFTDE